MRRKLLGLVAVTLALAACDNRISCSPCGPSGQIEVSALRAGSTSVRVCLDDVCADPVPLTGEAAAAGKTPTVWIGGAIYDAKSVRLDVYRGARRTDSFSGSVSLRRPSGKDCDCGESIRLAPAGGVLSRVDVPR
ncbi:hypothetical protein OHA70_01980 [Kribbella sp. NBC_00382]|uniref:hypothetical protein n=1 Tax=Kribbella sp. NBC_00382 TaxID=2975967 RepID=UPI002E1DFD53